MGFSVTASYVVITVALLAVGASAANAYWASQEELERARREQGRLIEERAATLLSVVSSEHDAAQQRYTVEVLNAGTARLRVSETTYLIDGAITDAMPATEVDGDAATDLWLPGETLLVRLSPVPQAPVYFQLVTGNGASVKHSE